MRRYAYPNESFLPTGLRTTVEASTNRVDFGASGITGDQITVALWVRRNATVGTNRPFWLLGDNTASTAGSMTLRQQTTDQLRLLIPQSTTLLDFTTSNFFATTLLPAFVAFTYDSSASVRAHIYQGTRERFVEECAYSASISGAGTHSTSAALSSGIFAAPGASSPLMDIFWVGEWNRILSLAELADVQFAPRRLHPQQILSAVTDKRATVLDESGFAHHGTPTNDGTNPMQSVAGLGYLMPPTKRLWWDLGNGSAATATLFRRSLTTRTGSRAA